MQTIIKKILTLPDLSPEQLQSPPSDYLTKWNEIAPEVYIWHNEVLVEAWKKTLNKSPSAEDCLFLITLILPDDQNILESLSKKLEQAYSIDQTSGIGYVLCNFHIATHGKLKLSTKETSVDSNLSAQLNLAIDQLDEMFEYNATKQYLFSYDLVLALESYLNNLFVSIEKLLNEKEAHFYQTEYLQKTADANLEEKKEIILNYIRTKKTMHQYFTFSNYPHLWDLVIRYQIFQNINKNLLDRNRKISDRLTEFFSQYQQHKKTLPMPVYSIIDTFFAKVSQLLPLSFSFFNFQYPTLWQTNEMTLVKKIDTLILEKNSNDKKGNSYAA